MNIVVEECGPGLFVATRDGPVLCRSRTPLLSAARVLLKSGADPKEELVMIREDGIISMRTTVGAAAKVTVLERELAPRFGEWVPFDARSVFPRDA